MSREGRGAGSGPGLRLLGAPVQLASREGTATGAGRRSRPRSAAAPRAHTPDLQEKGRRPFSADTKCPSSSIRNLLRSSEHRDFSFNDYSINDIRVGPPTAALLENHNQSAETSHWKPRELKCNASDQGSEDTYVSLGTKIKAKAQVNNSRKLTNKNYLKYRDIARKEQNVENKKDENRFDFKITILKAANKFDDDSSYGTKQDEKDTRTHDYYLPLDLENSNSRSESLAGRVSFGNGALHSEVEHAIDTYSRRLPSKQQLSLVEEESIQDLESMPSQHFSSPLPNAPVDKNEIRQNNDDDPDNSDSDHGTFILDSKAAVENGKPKNNVQQSILPKNNERYLENGPRTYSSFYEDFTAQRDNRFGNNISLSSTAFVVPGIDHSRTLHHSSSDPLRAIDSMDVDFPTKVINNFDKNMIVKSDGETHSSLECIALENTADSQSHTFLPRFACQWNEIPGHSRLQCKEFLSMKESEAIPKTDSDIVIKLSECKPNEIQSGSIMEEEYPEYLNNSISKAYTSKVIEDYKKEIQAINSLHKLTLKDIKTEVISPTPFNIDVMFDQMQKENNDIKDSPSKRLDDFARMNKKECVKKNNIDSANSENDIAKISTKELIQNYFKVKEGEGMESPIMPKVAKRKNPEKSMDRKVSNNAVDPKSTGNFTKSTSVVNKQKLINNCSSPLLKKNNRSETNNEIPLSSRIECVQNDKDVDSWMSMSVPTPRNENSVPHNSLASSSVSDVVRDIKLDALQKCSSSKGDNNTKLRQLIVQTSNLTDNANETLIKEVEKSSVLDIYTMLTEIENLGSNPVPVFSEESTKALPIEKEDNTHAKDNFSEIFTFLEKVEHSANEALSVITSSAPQVVPKLESLLRLPQTELAQRYVTAALQLEERSCCIALLQESLANHKEQMISRVNNLEKQSSKNIAKVKQECEEAVKRHQSFIDQLISDKKTLNHRIEQLVEERGSLEERWKRSAQALEQRYRLELKNQHDRMVAAQQVARQRWVRQKAEKIKELTVKGLEGELREIAERSSQEMSQLKMSHAEALGRLEVQHAADMERLRETLQGEHEAALARERKAASSRMERQIVELERAHAEQRTRLVAELRAEGERAAAERAERENTARAEIERWRQDQERIMEQKMAKLDEEIARKRKLFEEELRGKREALEEELERYKGEVDAEMQKELKRRVGEAAAAHKAERDREIERAIESLEGEAQRGRRELQDALRRNKEQYETELRELGETEKATLRRYQEAQARVRQTEDKCAELEATISQLETRNRVLTDKNSQLEGAAEACARSSEEAWRGKLDAAQREMDALRRTHDEQMHQLYAKVKVAVARKDSAIQALTREADKARERAATLEQRLQQQRKDFLKQK